jgi:hypothetical protein
VLNEEERMRLGRSIEASYRRLEPFRLLLGGLVREYAGPGYGENREYGGREKHMNLLNQAVDAYMMLLSANTPQVLISTHDQSLTAFASHFRLALNNLLREIDFGNTHHEWVLNAFFCIGILKVHIADTGQLVAADDVTMDPGMPFVSNVSLDNFVYDTSARKVTEAKFFGDIYRIPFESLKDGSVYNQKVVKKYGLKPTSKYGAEGETLAKISTGSEVDDDEYEPMIDLMDIYLPRDKKVYTFAVRSRQTMSIWTEPVASFDWIGTKRGPYHILGFSEVPENIMPVSPAAQLTALDKLINNLMDKQARQAHRQKENPVYTPAGADDARDLRNAADGEWVKVQDPREVNVIRQGGPDPGNQGFMLNTIEIFDRMAGNLPAMLGLGTSADTVGQEKLIHASSSRKEGKMQRRVLEATAHVIEELAFLLWQDDFKEIPGEMGLPGFPDYKVRSDWVPGDREGEFRDYNFQIDVYSLSYQSPGERVQAINTLLGQIYAPMMQMLMEQGGMIDFSRLTEIYAEMLNLPRLREIVVFAAPIGDTQPGGTAPIGAGKPATTERRYIRQDGNGGSPAVPDSSGWSQKGGTPSVLEAYAASKGR